ncbi:MAG: glycosyltransferase family 39 protein [Microthrixaceae bacterium]
MTLAPPPPAAPDRAAADVADAAARLAAELAAQEVRVSVALATTVAVEDRADRLVGDLTTTLRRLVDAARVDVPVLGRGPDVISVPHPAEVESAYLVEVRAAELRRRAAERRAFATAARGAGVERIVVALTAFLGFAAVGIVAATRGGALPGDAISRVQLALAVVAGRDPHPESIGFVWGPFPTLFEVPFVALRGLWPALADASVAAVLVSAACMAAALSQLVAWGRDCGSPRWTRIGVVVLTAASPLVLAAGANGMSEAAWVLFLLIACRRLAHWIEHDDVGSLVVTGLALGLAYLTRYESAAAIAAVLAVVAATTWRRPPAVPEGGPLVGGTAGPVRRRVRATALDLTVVGFPAVAAVVGWTFVSWVIVGEPFAQFTSGYGNAALVRNAGSMAGIIGDTTLVGRVAFFGEQLLTAAPVLVVLVLLVLWIGDRAAARGAVVLAVVGAPLALQLLLAARGQTFPWFRYVITGVMITALLALVAAGSWDWVRSHRWVRVPAVLSLLPGLVLSVPVVMGGHLGAGDEYLVYQAVERGLDGRRIPADESILLRGRTVAEAVDRVPGVVAGAILTDTSSTSAVVAAAPRPEVYVIPSDRDFEAVVADPAAFGVRYLLLRAPATPGDAVVASHPRLMTDTDPGFRRIREWGDRGDPSGQYLLYEVDSVVGRPRPVPSEGFRG